MSTGYTAERARPHDSAVGKVLGEMRWRGYDTVELAVDGHRPDARLADVGGGDYVEIKSMDRNLAIEVDSLNTYRLIEFREKRRVYIIWTRGRDQPRDWQVHTPDSITAGLKQGPRRRSGNGSLDDWYLCMAPGTPFDDFFPDLTEPRESSPSLFNPRGTS